MSLKRSKDNTKSGRLMLARKIGEPIFIETADGQKMQFEISDIRGNQVRMSFQAPPEIKIYRHDARHPAKEISKEGQSA